MRQWIIAAAAAAALLGASYSTHAGARMASSGGGRMHGFARGFRGFHGRPFGFDFGRGFAPSRFGQIGFRGGEVAAGDDDVDDYDEGGDDGLGNMHFRVQESFGPWDVGRRPPPAPEPYDSGPWDAARMDAWHGYEPDSW